MAGPFYVDADGKLPMQSGKPVLISESEFKECCCGTGCFCATVYEWNCDSGSWILVFQEKTFPGDLRFTPLPDDQWNYFYFKKIFPNREATIIRATYGTWIDCEEECTWASPPSAPNELWRQFKCDGSAPTPEPESEGKCQKMATYVYNCISEEWELIRIDDIRARLPAGSEVANPDEPWIVRVFGKVYDCVDGDDSVNDPDPPKKSNPDDFCAPAECPCPDADPAEWPCAGLLETYSTSGDQTSDIGDSINWKWSGIIVTATSDSIFGAGSSCKWVGSGTVTKTVGTGDPEDITAVIELFLTSAGSEWRVGVRAVFFGSDPSKSVGQTPVGNYLVSGVEYGTATVS